MSGDEPPWLAIAREMRAMAQTGLTFTQDGFDRQRYERLREMAAMLLSQGSAQELERVRHMLTQDKGYGTPKVDVRGAAFREDRILLVREISDGHWTLPGGWADVNQTPSECVTREIFEESGFTARALRLVGIYDYRRSNRPHAMDSIYKLFFLCELTGGTATPSDETSEVAFFAAHELPPLSVGRSSVAQIERMFEHHADRTLPPDFD
jgi:ADP-ribose pyrophosphatase YjhB (NUDIX family)